MAAAESWDDISDAYVNARHVDRALHMLCDYYSQSKGKKAIELIARLDVAYTGRAGPHVLACVSKREEATDPHAEKRRQYWTDVLRPLLTDAALMHDLQETTVRMKDMHITTAQRDAAIGTLQESVVYWDKHFGQ